MDLSILINNEDKTDLYLSGSLRTIMRADRKGTCRFEMLTVGALGQNIFGDELEVGYISPITGENVVNVNRSRTVGYTEVEAGVLHNITAAISFTDFRIMYYERDLTFISEVHETGGDIGFSFTPPANTKYIRFTNAATNDTSIVYYIAQGVVSTSEDYIPYMPKVGMDLQVYDGAEILFGGTIKSCPVQRPNRTDDVFVTVTSDGYNDITNRRTLNVARHNQTTGDIVNYLITDVLVQEGITAGTIDPGIEIRTYRATLKNCREILDELADMSGYEWWIDSNKELNFKENFSSVIDNVIINGNFAAGTANWDATGFNSTLSATANVMTIDSTGGADPAGMAQNTGVTMVTGQRVFVRMKVTGTGGVPTNYAFVAISDSLGAGGNNVAVADVDLYTADPEYVYGVATVTSLLDGSDLHVKVITQNDDILYVEEAICILPDNHIDLQGKDADQINGAITEWFDGSQEQIFGAPHAITEDGIFEDYKKLRVEENLEMYRNRQWVRGGDLPNGQPLLVMRSLPHERELRQLVEGGSGYHGRVNSFPYVQSRVRAGEIADALLEQYGEGGPPIELEFETNTPVFRPNQKLTARLPTMGINYERVFLVEEVQIEDIDGINFVGTQICYSRDSEDFVTRGTQTGVDFFSDLIKSAQKSEPAQVIQNNLVNDHSYELVVSSGTIHATHRDYLTTMPTHTSGGRVWMRQGDVRIISGTTSGVHERRVTFGRQAMGVAGIVNVQQYIPVEAGVSYTLSGFAIPHPTRNAAASTVRSRLLIYFYTSAFAETGVGDRVSDLMTMTTSHTAGALLDPQRHAVTVTAPATAVWARVFVLSGADTEWVVWDGMQMVEGTDIGMYEPENQLWRSIRDGLT